MLVESIDGPDLDEKAGVVTMTLHCMEWQPDFDTVKSSTPTGAKGGGRPTTVANDRDASWDNAWRGVHPDEAGPPPPVPPSYTADGPG
jgi:hypothetical protein